MIPNFRVRHRGRSRILSLCGIGGTDRMRIIVLYQYFKTREGHGSTRSYEFTRRLIDEGHDLLVLTSTARLPGFTGRRRAGLIEGEVDGIPVWAVPSEYSNRMGFARRVVEFLRFAAVSSIAVLRAPAPDLIFASSTPLTVAIPALVCRIVRGIPLVFEVRDLWPEVPIGMGILRSPILISFARALARLAYRASARIVALSPGMRDGIVRYAIPADRVAVIPNGSDLDLFHPEVDGSDLRRRLGLEDDRFVVVHPGAMGIVNGLEFLIPVCRELAEIAPQVVVLLVGDGSQKPRIEELAREAGLENLRFFPPVPKAEMPEWLAAADLGLMLIRRVPVLEMNSANKFFDYAAAGLPCLMNYGGWKAELLRRYEAGRAVESDDAALFAAEVAQLARRRETLREMAVGARRMAEEQFDRDRQFALLLETMWEAVGGAPA
ncbi:MAG: glycosyltransferase [Candidatus Eisenbacteria bacterium]|nr:glycosyltransferase [Candidatus Latescibacterota bacterium]MBD3301925.1 glycosyltransferase [Candidatus Eisenbacteria bacterium]